jgi:hypothetical protein
VFFSQVLLLKLTVFISQYNRFKLSRITTVYFALALLHCITQIALQIRGLGLEISESNHLHHIMNVGEVTDEFAILDSSDSILICHAFPGHTSDPHPCGKFPVFNAAGVAGFSLNTTVDTCHQVLAWPAQMCVLSSVVTSVFTSNAVLVFIKPYANP